MEVRAEGGECFGAGTEMVVDDVDDHAEISTVCRIDERGEALRAAVGGKGRRGVETVIAPARSPTNVAIGITSIARTPRSRSEPRRLLIASKVPASVKVPTWSS